MESRAKLFGHPIHQMLIVFPLGLLATSLFFDVIALTTDNPGLFQASWYMIAAGVLSGLLAAIFGAIDYFGIPKGTRAKRVGTMHGLGNVVVLTLFAASWWLRRGEVANPELAPVILSALGAALGGITGWLGGELVDRLGVGVDDGANLDAPSSLTHDTVATQRIEH